MKPLSLRLCPLAALLLCFLAVPSPTLRAAAPEPAKVEESITLPKFTVKGEPVCSFGMALVGSRDPATKKLQRLFISAVSEDSPAEHQGLKAGDEILTINGEKVAGMDGAIKPGARLFDLMINQPPGQLIKLEVAVRTVRTLTLQAGPDLTPSNTFRKN